MSITVIPPLTDPTLRVPVPSGTRLLDLNQAFLARQAAAAQDRVGAGDPVERAFRTAAVEIMARGVRDEAQLRALGHLTRMATADDPAITVALDDVMLRDGTTQRSVDLLRAVAATELFQPEVEQAVDAAGADTPVRLLVHTDQQLPAALAVARGLAAGQVRWCGRYVRTHHANLLRLRGLPPAGWDGSDVVREVSPEWSPTGAPLRWLPEWDGQEGDGRPWAGWLDAGTAAALPASLRSSCAGLTVTVVEARRWPRVTGADGAVAELGPLLSSLPADCPHGVEVLVGAPGLGGAAAEQTVHRLTADGDVRIAGFRPFRLPRRRTFWDSRIARIPSGHDLPLWDECEGPDVPTEAQRRQLVADLIDRYSATLDLFPGRVAAATVSRSSARAGSSLGWDPSAAVVAAGDEHVALSLRTGRALRIPPALAPVLHRWQAGTAAPARSSDPRRAGLLDRLLAAGILRDRQRHPQVVAG